jgi:alkylhydroperoxidase/carboxymuconolactone decarboxylase family protein YurZ
MSERVDPESQRLREAADRAEIIELLHRYASAIDTPDWELLPLIFTPDARIDFGSVDQYVEADSVVEGIDAIRAWFEAALAPFPDVLHFMTNHLVDIDGDEARTQTLMHVLNMSMGGIYRGHAVRTKKGWRLDRFSLEERTFDEAAARLTAHMQKFDAPGAGATGQATTTGSGAARLERAEAMLDKIFTPSWREHGGGVPVDSPAGRDFARLAVEHCYADAWSRGGRFDEKLRSLITLTALATMGATEELKLHVRGALNLGHQPDDIAELFVQLLPYVGTPRMVQAMRLAGEVFDEGD